MLLFKDGSHHPVALIVLQALVNLIGQVSYGCGFLLDYSI